MQEPASPDDEVDRLAALRALDILDTPAEERFDRLTRIASYVAGTPISLVSLIDGDRQWFKSRVGLDAPETPRSISFCGHAILRNDVFIIPDASQDERFADNPLVTGGPNIRFYAGVPLQLADNHRIGTLCVISPEPKQLSEEQIACLKDLAHCVTAEIQQHRAIDIGRELHAQREQMHTILESADSAIMSVDQDGIILSMNKAAIRMLGYAREELVGKSTPAIFHVEEEVVARARALSEEFGVPVEPGLDVFKLKALRGLPNTHEWTWVRKDGSRLPVELFVGARRDPEGVVTGFMGIATDLTERKRIEQVKDEFISTVSHELRTPLTSLRGALGLILGKFSDGMDARARQLLENANRNSERLTLLVNDILDLEKLEAGRMEFEFVRGDLVEAVRQAINHNGGYASKHDVQLELQAEVVTAPARFDEHRIQQVLANLVSNAVKYSPPQGVVTLRISETDTHWRIGIRDRGKGIPEAFRSHIFGRFSQADGSDSREKGGTGLGLNISRAIVERHQGRIHFESEEGVGTEFFVDLPRPQE